MKKTFVFTVAFLALMFCTVEVYAQTTTQNCTACNGTGRLQRNCSTCNGTGKGTIRLRNGTWEKPNCTTCNGSGKTSYSCSTCNGTGRVTVAAPAPAQNNTQLAQATTQDCTACKGTGISGHLALQGLNWVIVDGPCNGCNGTGKVTVYRSSNPSAQAAYDRGDFTEAIRLDPNFTGAYYSRGLNHHISYLTTSRVDEYQLAVADLQTAVRLDPNNQNIKNALNLCLANPPRSGSGVGVPSQPSSGSTSGGSSTSARDCGICHGSTLCQTCNGRGEYQGSFGLDYLPCPNCYVLNGRRTGLCSYCRGTGKI